MNRVDLLYRKDRIIGFEASGHTGYDEPGYDIVCAAVSVLTQTAENALDTLTDIAYDVTIDQAEGYLRVALTEEPNQDELLIINTIFDMMKIGLLGIIESYPDYVELHMKEV